MLFGSVCVIVAILHMSNQTKCYQATHLPAVVKKTYFDPDKKYGRLTILCRDTDTKKWLCRCDCGNEKLIRQGDIVSGKTQSCGCLQKEKAAASIKLSQSKAVKAAAVYHTTHGGRHDRLYIIWHSMIARCTYPSTSSYKYYGGRGISVCDEWRNDYAAFRKWSIDNGYDKDAKRGICTIDRIDVNGNYEPNNCRWVDMKTQANNKRPRKTTSA